MSNVKYNNSTFNKVLLEVMLKLYYNKKSKEKKTNMYIYIMILQLFIKLIKKLFVINWKIFK